MMDQSSCSSWKVWIKWMRYASLIASGTSKYRWSSSSTVRTLLGGEEKHQDTSLWEGKMEEKGDNKEEMGFLTRSAAGGDSLGRGLPEEGSVGRQGLQLVQRVC